MILVGIIIVVLVMANSQDQTKVVVARAAPANVPPVIPANVARAQGLAQGIDVPQVNPVAPVPGNILKAGAKITVRAEVQGVPPNFTGDYNRSVIQELEIAIRGLGYEPVPDGGLVLVVRSSVGTSGKEISVRSIGMPPPSFRPPQINPGLRPGTQGREQAYPIPQITADVVLSDVRGSAIWKNESTFVPHLLIFHGDPAAKWKKSCGASSNPGWARRPSPT